MFPSDSSETVHQLSDEEGPSIHLTVTEHFLHVQGFGRDHS